MMNPRTLFQSLIICACAMAITGCNTQKQAVTDNELALTRAAQTLDSLYAHYSAPGTCLLRENYPSTPATIRQLISPLKSRRISPTSILIYGPIPGLSLP